jgi:DMSO/TMAO reductase YedYZ molybdopterin-dependent catalytic subunit
MRVLRFIAVAALAVSAFSIAPAALSQEKPRLLTTRVEVTGAVQRAQSLAADDLRAIAARNDGLVLAASYPGDFPQAYRGYAGVRLTDVLNEADIRTDQRNALRRTYVVATASDGYKAVFSWGELFNAPVGRGVLIVFERDGSPLEDGEGRLALVSLVDARMGPRHVKWLSRVEVLRVPE